MSLLRIVAFAAHRARACRVGILAFLVTVLPAIAGAATITVQYFGTVDLTVFGGKPSTSFIGTVSWDPTGSWQDQTSGDVPITAWTGLQTLCLARSCLTVWTTPIASHRLRG